MFPPFDESEARQFSKELVNMIKNGSVILKQISFVSKERTGLGVMIGTLVTKDKSNGKKIILHALSGISKKLLSCDFENYFIDENDFKHIFVNDIVNSEFINSALQKNDLKIHELTYEINSLLKNKNENSEKISILKKERKILTDESLKNVFSLYEFSRFDQKKILLKTIIQKNKKLPPTGTGDCAEPKLLSYAFKKNLLPLSMAQIFIGGETKNKKNYEFYSPCDIRCKIILPEILGLEILYRDKDIIVVNKPSGLLSVPGRGEDKQDCVVNRLRSLFLNCIEQPAVHRLDMETSGLMVLAFTQNAHKILNQSFENREIQKEYVALLDGILEKSNGLSSPKSGEKSGTISLKFRLDVQNRPHQIYDEEFGKLGITYWENSGIQIYQNPDTLQKKKVTRIRFYPKTGRTHQLRLHSSDEHGFALPIIGDSLYGTKTKNQRLMLHASKLSFFHPTTKKFMEFVCNPDF